MHRLFFSAWFAVALEKKRKEKQVQTRPNSHVTYLVVVHSQIQNQAHLYYHIYQECIRTTHPLLL